MLTVGVFVDFGSMWDTLYKVKKQQQFFYSPLKKWVDKNRVILR